MTTTRPTFPFDNTYARLPETFYTRIEPTPVRSPRLIKLNIDLARQLGLDPVVLSGPSGLDVLAGNAVAAGSEPLAQAYAGHQFGGFVPRLGDGRACLLGELLDAEGRRWDLQLKGSGPTPYSRNGDGRAALGPVLREYLVSEAMAALGVPTTRALAAVLTGEAVQREEIIPGAILARVAKSHLRIGTFQYFAARDDGASLSRLISYAIARHDPDLLAGTQPEQDFLDAVIGRQARLIALWMGLGFIHGVMNTDNMTISGETIDFGPCAFMDTFDPAQVYSSIDRQGRYAFGNQPRIAQWNLARLAETLLPFLAPTEAEAIERANASIARFAPRFESEMLTVLRAKLGLAQAEEGDGALANAFLKLMADGRADYTNAWRGLFEAALGPRHETDLRLAFADATGLDEWLPLWRERLAREADDLQTVQCRMHRTNPAVIPRNHRIEEAIRAAVDDEDLTAFEQLHRILSQPFSVGTDDMAYARPPRPNEQVQRTFCGT